MTHNDYLDPEYNALVNLEEVYTMTITENQWIELTDLRNTLEVNLKATEGTIKALVNNQERLQSRFDELTKLIDSIRKNNRW